MSEPKAPSDFEAMLEIVASNVQLARFEDGVSRRQVAEQTGLSERFLADVEKRRANPSLRSLETLAKFAVMPVPEFLSQTRRLQPRLGAALAALSDEEQLRLAEELEARAARVKGGTRVALLGLRGAGKTTVGKLLAKRLGCAFVELDGRIEQAAGLPLSQVFEVHGDAYYRRLERETLRQVLAAPGDFVLATGGGLVSHEETYALLRASATTVWLKARAEEYLARVVKQGDRRPVERHPQALAELKALLAAREPAYKQAGLAIDTSTLEADECVRRIAAWLDRSRAKAGRG